MLTRLLLSFLLTCSLATSAFAFTEPPIVDSFNRANESPVSDGGKWTSPGAFFGGTDTLKTVTNALTITTNGLAADAYRNDQDYGPNSSACLKFANSTANNFSVYARLVQIGSGTTDGYNVVWISPSTVRIRKIDNAVNATLGADITQTVGTGDILCIEVTGSSTTTIKAWFSDNGGAYTELGSRDDSTSPHTAAGKVGVFINVDTATDPGQFDDFRAETIAASNRRPIAPIIFSRLADLTRFIFTFVEPSYALAQ